MEEAWRTLKHTLSFRPVYHRLEDRIRAHVLLYCLALLLVRVAENATGSNWASGRAAVVASRAGKETMQVTTSPAAAMRGIFEAQPTGNFPSKGYRVIATCNVVKFPVGRPCRSGSTLAVTQITFPENQDFPGTKG